MGLEIKGSEKYIDYIDVSASEVIGINVFEKDGGFDQVSIKGSVSRQADRFQNVNDSAFGYEAPILGNIYANKQDNIMVDDNCKYQFHPLKY